MMPAHESDSSVLEPRRGAHPPTLADAIERTWAAGQQLASDRVELVLLETRAWADRVGSSLGVLAAAGAAALLGWIGLAVALALWRWGGLPLEARLALVAAAHLVLACLLLLWARRRMAPERSSTESRHPAGTDPRRDAEGRS